MLGQRLIREWIRSGLARVKATGRTRSGRAVGRRRRNVAVRAIHPLRAAGESWQEFAHALDGPRRTLTPVWVLEANPGRGEAT